MKNNFPIIGKPFPIILLFGLIISILLIFLLTGAPSYQYFFPEKSGQSISGQATRVFVRTRAGSVIQTVLKFTNISSENFSATVDIYDSKGSLVKNSGVAPVNNLAPGRSSNVSLHSPTDAGTFIVKPSSLSQKYNLEIIESEYSNKGTLVKSLSPIVHTAKIIPVDTKLSPRFSVRLTTDRITSEKVDIRAYSSLGEEITLKLNSLVFENSVSIPIHEQLGPDFLGFLLIMTEHENTAITKEESPSSQQAGGKEQNSATPNSSNVPVPTNVSPTSSPTAVSSSTPKQPAITTGLPAASSSPKENSCLAPPTLIITEKQGIPAGSVDLSMELSQRQKGTVIPFLSKEEIADKCSNLESGDGLGVLNSGSDVVPSEWSSSLADACGKFVGACFLPCADCGSQTTSTNEVPSPSLLIGSKEIECNDRKKLYLKETNDPGAHCFIESSNNPDHDDYSGECPKKDGMRCLYYKNDSVVTMSAVAPGHESSSWQVDCSKSNPGETCSLTMDVDHTVEIVCKIPTVNLYLKEIKDGTDGKVSVAVSSGQRVGDCEETNETAAKIRDGYRCEGRYAEGSKLALTASPDLSFVGYSGDCSGADSLCNLTLSRDSSVTDRHFSVVATFTKQRRAGVRLFLTVHNAHGSTGTVPFPADHIIAENGNCKAPECKYYRKGSTVRLEASPLQQFIGWAVSNNCSFSGQNATCKMNSDKSVRANFDGRQTKVYVKEINTKGVTSGKVETVGPSVVGSCAPADGYRCYLYNVGAELTFNAAPTEQFYRWSVKDETTRTFCQDPSNPSCNLTVPATTLYVTGEFRILGKKKLYLKVNSNVPGNSIKASSLAPVEACASADQLDGWECKLYKETAAVTLTADKREFFTDWTGDCRGKEVSCTVRMLGEAADHRVTANFFKDGLALNYAAVNEFGSTGKVTLAPGGFGSCGAKQEAGYEGCQLYAKSNSFVYADAVSGSEDKFTGWDNSRSSCQRYPGWSLTNPTCLLVMNAPQKVLANFTIDLAKIPHKKLRYVVENKGLVEGKIQFPEKGFLGACEQDTFRGVAYQCRLYRTGTTVTMKAKPANKLETWLDNCGPEGSNSTCQKRLSEDRRVGARFYAPAVCGDRTCETDNWEDSWNCPEDCGPPPSPCGNGRCQPALGENCNSCRKDCVVGCGTPNPTSNPTGNPTSNPTGNPTPNPTSDGGGCATILCGGTCCPPNTRGACANLGTSNERCPGNGPTPTPTATATFAGRYCGDLTCDAGYENSSSCPQDCCSAAGTGCNPNSHNCCSNLCNAAGSCAY